VKLASLAKVKAGRVMGIDCSTHSLAFCVFYNRRPVRWGKIEFVGSDVFERMRDAAQKMHALAETFDVDYIVFESAILAKVSNADTTIKLAMVYGVCIAELMNQGTKVVTVKPLEWQSYINNPNFTKTQKEALKKERPGMSAGWYSNEIRNRRKQKTMDYFNKKWPHLNLTDNDVGDAFGLAYFGYYKHTRR
jgi:Holliday junction resolvasome RuvABC endonuclease subunit